MANIRRLHVSPALINSSCAWASSESQLLDLYECAYTGAVTTRTATLNGFKETNIHQVIFSSDAKHSINSYGYSPHPLSYYLNWVENTLQDKTRLKPVIISITSSNPEELANMIGAVQGVRHRLGDMNTDKVAIAIELNTSCPNIDNKPPPAYTPTSLAPFLHVLAEAFRADRTLVLGLKLPPYTYSTQFVDILGSISNLSRDSEDRVINPIAFLTCTNTLGNSLLYADQILNGSSPEASNNPDSMHYALPTPLGGLAGESIHALALGNVFTFNRLLSNSVDTSLREIAIIGVGGVRSPAAAARMRNAGALIVGCATYLGQEGVRAFELLSSQSTEHQSGGI